ncbi:MAG: ABC transporter substrate-binding protein, partial [Planctomycetota bacterium]
ASIIAAVGSEAAEDWCNGVVANLARVPQGGDRDQIRAVAAGEGDVAIVNHYYLALMLDSDDPSEKVAAEAVRPVFPNQDDRGTHINICGAGVMQTAPNRENAIRLLEFLAGAEAQAAFAAGNYEYPVATDAEAIEVVQSLGEFKADEVVVSELGNLNAEAVRIMDRSGWR